MARIAGVNLPREKRTEIGLTYIYGIGRSTSQKVCGELTIDRNTKVRDLTDAEVARLRAGGVKFRNEVVTGPGGKQVLAQDPDGNLVELFQPAGT